MYISHKFPGIADTASLRIMQCYHCPTEYSIMILSGICWSVISKSFPQMLNRNCLSDRGCEGGVRVDSGKIMFKSH